MEQGRVIRHAMQKRKECHLFASVFDHCFCVFAFLYWKILINFLVRRGICLFLPFYLPSKGLRLPASHIPPTCMFFPLMRRWTEETDGNEAKNVAVFLCSCFLIGRGGNWVGRKTRLCLSLSDFSHFAVLQHFGWCLWHIFATLLKEMMAKTY